MTDNRELSQQLVAGLRAGLGDELKAVALFGSRARGDHRSESDWDLLIIAEGLPEGYFDRQLLMSSLLSACRLPLSPITRTPQEFESHVPSLYLDVALDARILYDPSGYLTHRLARLRRLIDEAGLSRERTAAGDVWSWKQPPQGPWIMTWDKIGEP